MSFSGEIRADHVIADTKIIIRRFLEHEDCFDKDNEAKLGVFSYPSVSDRALDMARLEFQITSPNSESTGAGRHKSNSEFVQVFIELSFKASETGGGGAGQVEADLTDYWDILSKHFRSVNGAPYLGGAGLRNAKLVGPSPGKTKYYYEKRGIIEGWIEVK